MQGANSNLDLFELLSLAQVRTAFRPIRRDEKNDCSITVECLRRLNAKERGIFCSGHAISLSVLLFFFNTTVA